MSRFKLVSILSAAAVSMAALVAQGGGVAQAAAAVGQPAVASNSGTIVNLGSGLCLQPVPDAFQNITDSGVRIAQKDCDSSVAEQKWQSLQVGTSGGQPIYYLINQLSNKCLDVTDSNTDDRAPIQQYVNSRTRKCLDVPNATTSPTYIWQYRCTDSNVAQAYTFPS